MRIDELPDEGLVVTPSVLASGYYAGEGVSQAVKDAWMHGYEYANRLWCEDIPPPITEGINRGVTAECARFTYEDGSKSEIFKDLIDKEITLHKVPVDNGDEGIKEVGGKLDYSEINLEILDLMAIRFAANKDKYPKGNMKKRIELDKLLWPAFRHLRKMIQPIDGDVESFEDHLAAVMCNCSMILDQLKLKQNEV